MASSEHRIAVGTQVSRLACYLFPPLGSVCKPRDAPFIYCFCHKGVLLSGLGGIFCLWNGHRGGIWAYLKHPLVHILVLRWTWAHHLVHTARTRALGSPSSLGWLGVPGRIQIWEMRGHISQNGTSPFNVLI